MRNLANFATSTGEKQILEADKFWSAIMSGDPTQLAKVLGPQMSGINRRAQQSKKTTSEFGNRGGGTNAGMQMTDDTTRSSIDTMISQLTGGAASAEGASGAGLLSTGESAHGAAFSEASKIQELNAAKWNDIFKSIADVAGAVAGGFPAGSMISKIGTGIEGGMGG